MEDICERLEEECQSSRKRNDKEVRCAICQGELYHCFYKTDGDYARSYCHKLCQIEGYILTEEYVKWDIEQKKGINMVWC